MPVVFMILRYRATLTRPDLQFLLVELAKMLITNEVHIWMEHFSGEKNLTADKLSRFIEDPLDDLSFQLAPGEITCAM